MNISKNIKISGGMRVFVPLLLALITTMAVASQASAQEVDHPYRMVLMAPARGYLFAHEGVRSPLGLLGGPVHVKISQRRGGVYVGLPDKRKLDPRIFGTPEMPRAFAGTSVINGVSLTARNVEDDHYTTMNQPSPFGDKVMEMADGKLNIDAVDATATDATTTKDNVQMTASWKDEAGNTYEVRCCHLMAAHGREYPTFGGVVTNHLVNGFTRIGTALMPTEYAYFAFWGMGDVRKNGQVLDKPRLIHGMLTEYVRKEDYALAFDEEVTPTRQHFQLIVAPFMPGMMSEGFNKKPVQTGFTLPNGTALPFWYVTFENLEIDGRRSE